MVKLFRYLECWWSKVLLVFGQHGPELFESLLISSVPSSVFQALQHCHQSGGQFRAVGKVKVRGPIEQFASSSVLMETLQSGLPEGLLPSPSLLWVTLGTVHVPVVNVGISDVLLFPCRVLGMLTSVHVLSFTSRT